MNTVLEGNQIENFLLFGSFRSFLVLVVTTLCMWLAKFHWNRRKLYRLSSKIQGPRGYPIIGSAHIFTDTSMEKILLTLINYFETYPDVFKFWLGSDLAIAVSKPEYLEIVLNHPQCLRKSKLYDVTKSLVGNGLFTGPVHLWRKHRKVISPSFNRKILQSFVKIFNEKAINVTEIMVKNAGVKKDQDVFSLLSACSVDILCDTVMGVTTNAQSSDDHIGKWVHIVEEIFISRMTNPQYRPDFMFRWTNKKKILDESISAMKKFIKKLIIDRKKILEKKNNDRKEGILVEDEISDKITLDVLLRVNKDGTKLEEEEIQDEVTTFLSAGADTTADAICFCLLALGMYPEIQEKVYKEVIDVLGVDRDVTAEDLPCLQYLERFIKETLRVFPAAPLLTRSPSVDIDIGDTVLPADSIILIFPMFNHRSPKYWKDPLMFDPDRFLPEEVAKRHPYSFLPFSAGPRGCIGYKFAYMAMKSILATIVRKLVVKTEYKSIEEVRLKLSFLLKPCDGFKLSLERRE